ncbi:MAG: sugar ABC transporter permease [Halanaerobiales bacterium]|nr:sugar ABC transporter permease [Halanaerobiales bacterium]
MKNCFKKLSIAQKQTLWAYVFLFVPLVFYLVIRIYPAFNAFYLSLTNWDIVSVEKDMVFFENYFSLSEDPLFWKTLGNTFKYVIYGLPINLVLSFLIAYNLNKLKWGLGIYRTLYFIPFMTSLVAVSWVWRWLYQPLPLGFFNNLLSLFGIPEQPFLMAPSQALPSILAPTIWVQMGFQVIIFLAGLKAIPQSVYEAADIDGANNRQKLFRVTIPLLRPTIIFLVITGTIKYLRIFTQVYSMTYQGNGGPLNSTKPLVLYIYNTAFQRFDMGYASAMTVVLFLIILVITLFQLKVLNKDD